MSANESLIRFPYLGIEFEVGKILNIGNFSITYYGLCIGIGMLLGILIVFYIAKKTGQKVDDYLDFSIVAIICGVIGARLYYCIFNWGYYSSNPIKIITGFREGGLAIYGGVLAALLVLVIFVKVKKMKFFLMADTACIGLIVGQIIGRWGNFFNREAFGGFTNSILAMQIPASVASNITRDLLLNAYIHNGQAFIQVHPTFLYESSWNLILLIILLVLTKKKVFEGEVFATYMIGYGIGRSFIEMLRTDKLLIPYINFPVSVAVSVIMIAMGLVIYTNNFLKKKK